MSDARVHYVVLKQQPRTTHPRTNHPHQKEGTATTHKDHAARKPETPNPEHGTQPTQATHHIPALLPQDPTVCQTRKPARPAPHPFPQHPPQREGVRTRNTTQTNRPLSADIPPMSTHRRTCACAMGFASTHPPDHPCEQTRG